MQAPWVHLRETQGKQPENKKIKQSKALLSKRNSHTECKIALLPLSGIRFHTDDK